MSQGARRLPAGVWQRTACRALPIAFTVLSALAPAALAETITSARYTEPTSRYAHGILGDAEEWGALEILTSDSNSAGTSSDAVARKTTYTIRLPLTSVFEDTEPRLTDVDGDGKPEVIVVETSVTQGASLAIYNQRGKITATPYIGTRNRWLAPIAIADLDGDGLTELAYIDRPHLAKTLRVWRFAQGTLEEVASLQGLTNHRIGERDIGGGLRNCAGKPEMIVANADWSRLMAVTWTGTTLTASDIGPHKNRRSFARALACK